MKIKLFIYANVMNNFLLTKILLFGLLLIGILIVGCSNSHLIKIPPAVPDDRNHVPEPKSVRIHPYGEYFEKQVIMPIGNFVDLSRQYRKLTGTRKEAINVDAFGEVSNSSWFTNRNAHKRMSLEEIARGPNTGFGPDTSNVWIVTRAKAEGVTPGFTIKDIKGDSYVLKFDPVGYPELASGPEVVSTKLFYAMGYNTPENYLVLFNPNILQLGEEVKFTDKKGRNRIMNEQDLQEILSNIEKLPNGRIRAVASKYLEGVPIGPFTYEGVRKDDLNDFIPHQHRRELRGLRIIAAWLNHFDTKDGNTLDMYVTENGKSYVKHYLIDFGATLGSASTQPNYLWRGHQYDVDPGVIIANIFTLGLYVRPWEKQEGLKYPSAGIFDAELFNPMKYKALVPNPAFLNTTLLDGYWAAKIVMSLTDEQLKTAIKQGQYSEPEAEEFLLQTVIKRRNKIGEYFFHRLNPLDCFTIQVDDKGNNLLSFKDLAVETGLESKEETEYKYQVRLISENEKRFLDERHIHSNHISFKEFEDKLYREFSPQNQNYGDCQVEISIQTNRNEKEEWSKPVKVYLSLVQEGKQFELITIKRET